VWNEPHNELHGNWTVEQYAATVRATREGAHRADPTVKIADNWDGSLKQYANAGGIGAFDILTIHPYSPGLNANPPIEQGPEAAGLLDSIRATREELISNGFGALEIWSTEFGWPTATAYAGSVSELNQARYLIRSSVLQLASGVKRVNPFRLTDVPFWGPRDGSFGLARADDTPKPSLCAYAIMAQTINDLPYAGQYNVGPNIGAFVFANRSRCVLALWRTDSQSSLTLHVAGRNIALVKLFGARTYLTLGARTISIGPSPVFISIDAPVEKSFSGMGKLIIGDPVNVFT
jgi:hypothetical protein